MSDIDDTAETPETPATDQSPWSAAPPPPPPPPWGPPPPPWGPPPPPWGAPWSTPPTTSAAPGGAGPGRAGLALTLVAAIVAGLLGVAVGSRLASNRTVALPATNSTPGSGSTNNGGGLFGGGNGGGFFGGGNSGNGNSGSAGTTNNAPVTGVAAKIVPSVVDIDTKLSYQGAAAAGTGLVLTPNGEILTNNHVIDGATSITVTAVDTGKTYTAHVVGTDPTEDIAILRLDNASGLKPISTSKTPTIAVGDQVVAIGNAGGVGGTPSVVNGSVSATNQTITASDDNGTNAEQLSGLIETNAPIQPGDSGGPLVNAAGDVIGIDTAASSRNRFDSAASVGFAIPMTQALTIAHQIEAGQLSSTVHLGLPAFLGVAVDPSAGNGAGAVVSGVEPNSPASTLGLQNGDTITTVDGKSVTTPATLTTLLRVHRPGDKATIGWTDSSGSHRSGSVTLESGPAD